MARNTLIRDYPQLSYMLTVVADDSGITQLTPDQQVIPSQFLARFEEGERQLLTFKDTELDELALGAQDSDGLQELIERAPEAASIIDDVFDGAFWDFVFEPRGSLPASLLPAAAEPA